jgi:hypothetical protein
VGRDTKNQSAFGTIKVVIFVFSCAELLKIGVGEADLSLKPGACQWDLKCGLEQVKNLSTETTSLEA